MSAWPDNIGLAVGARSEREIVADEGQSSVPISDEISTGEKPDGDEIKTIIEDFVDFLMPELTPSETSLYLFLLRNTYLRSASMLLRVGKRRIAMGYGKGLRGEKTNFEHMSKLCKSLEEKGCIRIGDANRKGTLFEIILPKDMPLVQERIAESESTPPDEENYFSIQEKRLLVMERDNWICQYCGERLSNETATLDHYIPQSKGGDNSKENLRTACFTCNSIKSGKLYDEAAPFLLKSLRERREKGNVHN